MTAPWLCPWCVEVEVPEPGRLCEACAAESDAIEFKAAHDASCQCVLACALDVLDVRPGSEVV